MKLIIMIFLITGCAKAQPARQYRARPTPTPIPQPKAKVIFNEISNVFNYNYCRDKK